MSPITSILPCKDRYLIFLAVVLAVVISGGLPRTRSHNKGKGKSKEVEAGRFIRGNPFYKLPWGGNPGRRGSSHGGAFMDSMCYTTPAF